MPNFNSRELDLASDSIWIATFFSELVVNGQRTPCAAKDPLSSTSFDWILLHSRLFVQHKLKGYSFVLPLV